MNIREIFKEISDTILPIMQRYRRDIQELNVRNKEDNTILTDADIDVQNAIVQIIRTHDPKSRIIAEEETKIESINDMGRYTWIIDPIDGTKEFVSPQGKEFCTAICVLLDEMPIGAMVLLPEITKDNKPLLIEATKEKHQIYINDMPAIPNVSFGTPKAISSTRSSGSNPHEFEEKLLKHGCALKTRTTSQTIDLLRVGIDLSSYSDSPLGGFDLFYRREQKIWDGAPGIFINLIAGRIAVDEKGNNLIPFLSEILKHEIPTLPISIVGGEEQINYFLQL